MIRSRPKSANSRPGSRSWEKNKQEAENSEIVDIVRGMSISLEELPWCSSGSGTALLDKVSRSPGTAERRKIEDETLSGDGGGAVCRRSLCGFSVPAYAYADGGEGADYGDPTMTEETQAPEPEPTIEPGEGFSEEGNLVTRDLLYDEHTNKQFITVQTAGGNTFYIVIDYDKPVDEEGEQYETYFFSVVDEADLLATAEAAGVEQAVCSCSEKCAAGAVNTECAVCSVNMNKCAGVEPEPEPTETEEPTPEEAEPETGGNMGMLLAVLAVALVGGGAAFYFKVLRPKQQKAAEPQEDYGGELDDYDGPDGYGDEDDDGPPWDEEDEDGEEADK